MVSLLFSSTVLLCLMASQCSATMAANCSASYDCISTYMDDNLVCVQKTCRCKEGYIAEETTSRRHNTYTISCYKIEFMPIFIGAVAVIFLFSLAVYTIASMKKNKLGCFA